MPCRRPLLTAKRHKRERRENVTIRRLPRKLYTDHVLRYTSESAFHYRASLVETKDGFSFTFKKEPLPEVLHRECFDTLFQPYWKGVTAYGAFENADGAPVAYLELAREEWNDRLVITQLLVEEPYRGKGIGKTLVDHAKKIAVHEDRRLITLETQSCNLPAIEFYRKQGFVFSGTNLHFYSNDDIAENEVMLEMCYLY